MIRYSQLRLCGQLLRPQPFLLPEVHSHRHSLCVPRYETAQTKRHLSFFSFFQSKDKKEVKTSMETGKSREENEASKSWLESVRSFDQYELLYPSGSTKALTRTETRRLKKQAFLHAIRNFLARHEKTRRGFNQFALSALQQMSAYEVQDDLDCYKAIIQLFPTGRMTVTSFLQAEWNHFPRQQKTMIQILQQMTENHVLPDDEVGQMIIDVFGWRNHAMKHYRHLMYWMPKLAHANPWPVLLRILDELDENPIYLTQLIAERISPDRMTKFQLIQLNSKDALLGQPVSLVSAQSPEQQAVLSYCTSRVSLNTGPESTIRSGPVIYLDGPHFVWYRTLQAAYYTLWTELDSERLEKEKVRVHRRESWITHKTLVGLPQLGHSALPIDHQLDAVPTLPDSTTRTLRLAQSADSQINKPMLLDPKHVLATQGSAQLTTSEPEYDNRWLSLRHSHEYRFLPNELTVHEQGEGTILAIGVVTPMQDALDNQKTRFAQDGPLTTSAKIPNLSTLPPVPKPAPEQLLRLWLAELERHNPGLSRSTLVMRISNPKPVSPKSDTSHCDSASPVDDVRESQTQACRD